MEYIATQTAETAWNDCEERLRDQLFRSPSVLGRLVAVCERLNAINNNRDGDEFVAEFGYDRVHCSLRRLHEDVFSTWISFSFRQQHRDISIWLSWLGAGAGDKMDAVWLLQPQRQWRQSMIPPGTSLADRDIFLNDFEYVAAAVRADLQHEFQAKGTSIMEAFLKSHSIEQIPDRRRGSDRRKETRMAISPACATLSASADRPVDVLINDISRTGISIISPRAFTAGTRIIVVCDAMAITASAVHCKQKITGQYAIGAAIIEIMNKRTGKEL